MRWGLIGQRCPKEPEKCGKWKTFQKPRNSSEANKTEGLPQCSQLLFAGGLACYTQEEIGEAVGLFQQDVAKAVEAQKMDSCPKSVKLLATYTDAEWKPPLYDIWSRLTDSALPPQES